MNNWQKVSHANYDSCMITSYESNGIYKHIKFRKNFAGLPVGNGKVTYSKGMDGKDYDSIELLLK